MDGLTRFRIDGPKKLVEVLAVPKDGHGIILAFDQALAKIGWALLRIDGVERFVLRTGMIKTEPTPYSGFEDSFVRGTFLAQGLRSIMSSSVPGNLVPDLVVHEMPVIMGPKVPSRNKEGAIVAAMAVRIVADECMLPIVMLNRQHVYKRLGLPPRATKKQVGDYVRSKMPDLAVRKPGPLNEDTYDAIVLALVAAEGDWL